MILYLRQYSKTHGGDGKSSFRLQPRTKVPSISFPTLDLQASGTVPRSTRCTRLQRSLRSILVWPKAPRTGNFFRHNDPDRGRKVALAANGTRKQQYCTAATRRSSERSHITAAWRGLGLITEATFKKKFKFLLRHCILYSTVQYCSLKL
jgi:hypothetical protein